MRNNKTLFTIIAALVIALFSFSACQKDTVAGETGVKELAGEWWVQSEEVGATYFNFSTYNTAANSGNEIWLDDMGTFWGAKGKVAADVSSLTFSATNSPNADPDYAITFNIKNGKVIKSGTKGPASGAVTDSIYFEAEYSDDPGTIYHMSGYRRTRYTEDDH